MIKIIFGTQNKAKIDQINGALSGTDISVLGLPEGSPKLEIEEDGLTARENAHKKATAYAKLLNRTVFAMDNALYFKGLPAEKQPALKVRRFRDDSRPSDTEMLLYYKDLISEISSNEIDGWWEFGLCIASPSGTCNETTIISTRKFVLRGSKKIVDGYPLESIQKDPGTGKIVSEMTGEEQKEFWKREIGTKVLEFVLASLNLL
jgi:hypothetical protein